VSLTHHGLAAGLHERQRRRRDASKDVFFFRIFALFPPIQTPLFAVRFAFYTLSTQATPAQNVGHLQAKMVAAPLHAAPLVYGALPKHSQRGQLAIFDPKKAMEGLKHNPTKAELMGMCRLRASSLPGVNLF
jgi:hypothetical protein